MKYKVEFQTINGYWYDHNSHKTLADAIAEIEFHIAVSGKAAYGFRVLDVDTQNFVLENYL